MMFSMFVAGWCGYATLDAALEGRAGWAVLMLACSALNLGFALYVP